MLYIISDNKAHKFEKSSFIFLIILFYTYKTIKNAFRFYNPEFDT